jgi:hypothetical protein
VDEFDLEVRRHVLSEEHLARWLEPNGWEAGATLGATQLNDLARVWWSTRLERDWRPRTVEESQDLLRSVGLVGEFWTLR